MQCYYWVLIIIGTNIATFSFCTYYYIKSFNTLKNRASDLAIEQIQFHQDIKEKIEKIEELIK